MNLRQLFPVSSWLSSMWQFKDSCSFYFTAVVSSSLQYRVSNLKAYMSHPGSLLKFRWFQEVWDETQDFAFLLGARGCQCCWFMDQNLRSRHLSAPSAVATSWWKRKEHEARGECLWGRLGRGMYRICSHVIGQNSGNGCPQLVGGQEMEASSMFQEKRKPISVSFQKSLPH